MTLQVGIYIYDEVEVLDFAGPFEVFSTASRVFARSNPEEPEPFVVGLIAQAQGGVNARAGFRVQPRHTIEDHPPIDILIVPGGVHRGEMEKPEVIAWIGRQHDLVTLTASVCTGAFLLARAGVLSDQEVTTHWEDIAELQRIFPKLRVRDGVRWIEHEQVATSAGISAGIDMSLRLVARFAGQPLAERTARQMDYEWRKQE